jgi:uncharacterized membrane protein
MVERNPEPSLVSYVHVMYALHALAAFIGITSTVTIVGQFIFGLPSIIAVIMSYMRRAEARGTWLESHFTWQLRTFWYAALWVVLIAVASAPFMLILVGFFTCGLGLAVIGLWVIYRVARGWLTLKEGKAIGPPQP